MANFAPRVTLSIVHHLLLRQHQHLFLSQAPHQDLHQRYWGPGACQFCLQSHRRELLQLGQFQQVHRALHQEQHQGLEVHQGPVAHQVQDPHQQGESLLVPSALSRVRLHQFVRHPLQVMSSCDYIACKLIIE